MCLPSPSLLAWLAGWQVGASAKPTDAPMLCSFGLPARGMLAPALATLSRKCLDQKQIRVPMLAYEKKRGLFGGLVTVRRLAGRQLRRLPGPGLH
jgi:hypothetical protein